MKGQYTRLNLIAFPKDWNPEASEDLPIDDTISPLFSIWHFQKTGEIQHLVDAYQKSQTLREQDSQYYKNHLGAGFEILYNLIKALITQLEDLSVQATEILQNPQKSHAPIFEMAVQYNQLNRLLKPYLGIFGQLFLSASEPNPTPIKHIREALCADKNIGQDSIHSLLIDYFQYLPNPTAKPAIIQYLKEKEFVLTGHSSPNLSKWFYKESCLDPSTTLQFLETCRTQGLMDDDSVTQNIFLFIDPKKFLNFFYAIIQHVFDCQCLIASSRGKDESKLSEDDRKKLAYAKTLMDLWYSLCGLRTKTLHRNFDYTDRNTKEICLHIDQLFYSVLKSPSLEDIVDIASCLKDKTESRIFGAVGKSDQSSDRFPVDYLLHKLDSEKKLDSWDKILMVTAQLIRLSDLLNDPNILLTIKKLGDREITVFQYSLVNHLLNPLILNGLAENAFGAETKPEYIKACRMLADQILDWWKQKSPQDFSHFLSAWRLCNLHAIRILESRKIDRKKLLDFEKSLLEPFKDKEGRKVPAIMASLSIQEQAQISLFIFYRYLEFLTPSWTSQKKPDLFLTDLLSAIKHLASAVNHIALKHPSTERVKIIPFLESATDYLLTLPSSSLSLTAFKTLITACATSSELKAITDKLPTAQQENLKGALLYQQALLEDDIFKRYHLLLESDKAGCSLAKLGIVFLLLNFNIPVTEWIQYYLVGYFQSKQESEKTLSMAALDEQKRLSPDILLTQELDSYEKTSRERDEQMILSLVVEKLSPDDISKIQEILKIHLPQRSKEDSTTAVSDGVTQLLSASLTDEDKIKWLHEDFSQFSRQWLEQSEDREIHHEWFRRNLILSFLARNEASPEVSRYANLYIAAMQHLFKIMQDHSFSETSISSNWPYPFKDAGFQVTAPLSLEQTIVISEEEKAILEAISTKQPLPQKSAQAVNAIPLPFSSSGAKPADYSPGPSAPPLPLDVDGALPPPVQPSPEDILDILPIAASDPFSASAPPYPLYPSAPPLPLDVDEALPPPVPPSQKDILPIAASDPFSASAPLPPPSLPSAPPSLEESLASSQEISERLSEKSELTVDPVKLLQLLTMMFSQSLQGPSKSLLESSIALINDPEMATAMLRKNFPDLMQGKELDCQIFLSLITATFARAHDSLASSPLDRSSPTLTFFDDQQRDVTRLDQHRVLLGEKPVPTPSPKKLKCE